MYSDRFERCMVFTFQWEGYGNSATAGDTGGYTIWGISSRYFPNEVTQMKNMSPEDAQKYAKAIYWNNFWLMFAKYNINLDDPNMPTKIALALFDAGVNHGVSVSTALYLASTRQDAQYTFDNLMLERLEKYNDLVKAHENNVQFHVGWNDRVFALRRFQV